MRKHPKTEVSVCACGDTAWAVIDEKKGDRLHVAIVDPHHADLLGAHRWWAYCPHKKIAKDRRKHVYYARRDKQGERPKTKLLHREVMGVTDSRIHVDHENHNGLDCRERNLRGGTLSQNRGNARTAINNTSGYKGVSLWRRRKWRAVCGHVYIGLFDCKHDAARAYNRAARLRFGEFAKLNVIEGGLS